MTLTMCLCCLARIPLGCMPLLEEKPRKAQRGGGGVAISLSGPEKQRLVPVLETRHQMFG